MGPYDVNSQQQERRQLSAARVWDSSLKESEVVAVCHVIWFMLWTHNCYAASSYMLSAIRLLIMQPKLSNLVMVTVSCNDCIVVSFYSRLVCQLWWWKIWWTLILWSLNAVIIYFRGTAVKFHGITQSQKLSRLLSFASRGNFIVEFGWRGKRMNWM